jgi:hypothetical protein
LVKQLPEIGVPTPKLLGHQEDCLHADGPQDVQPKNWESDLPNLQIFGIWSPKKKKTCRPLRAYTLSGREGFLLAAESVQLSTAERDSSWPVRVVVYTLGNQEESLVHSQRPGGIPPGHWEHTLSATKRNSSWFLRVYNSCQPRGIHLGHCGKTNQNQSHSTNTFLDPFHITYIL